MTLQTQMVLRQALVEPTREWYGLEMVLATGLPTGTVYPIIARLEQAGWITSRWENVSEQATEARPRRRYYQFTADGTEEARLALAKAHANRVTTPVSWSSLGTHPDAGGAGA
ncbi:PadR family transcriptional regulator [Actinomadura violacea]|uniref:Helix-turn-helix transcriptional regulator n=1 Tax=Actinomadura violacea TaxID=2819934 RepID=A0ABS3RWK3_9ACTN|nr:helix-turn-helix transcriptional regulator [Actinomadura violacea]MBO2461146.1 helix-turn-helix transcriptional regulator [Actinomadura violacea]